VAKSWFNSSSFVLFPAGVVHRTVLAGSTHRETVVCRGHLANSASQESAARIAPDRFRAWRSVVKR